MVRGRVNPSRDVSTVAGSPAARRIVPLPVYCVTLLQPQIKPILRLRFPSHGPPQVAASLHTEPAASQACPRRRPALSLRAPHTPCHRRGGTPGPGGTCAAKPRTSPDGQRPAVTRGQHLGLPWAPLRRPLSPGQPRTWRRAGILTRVCLHRASPVRALKRSVLRGFSRPLAGAATTGSTSGAARTTETRFSRFWRLHVQDRGPLGLWPGLADGHLPAVASRGFIGGHARSRVQISSSIENTVVLHPGPP